MSSRCRDPRVRWAGRAGVPGMALSPRNLIWATLVACALGACEREQRHLSAPASPPAILDAVTVSELHPGGGTGAPPSASPYDGNAYQIAQGQRLFEWFNCVGCHAHGGGGIGPALMDAQWIYGSEPADIYATIVEGRPNGMPSFRGRLTQRQVWQLVAYVRSLSGGLRKDVSPARSDEMNVTPAPSQTQTAAPRQSFLPQPAQH